MEESFRNCGRLCRRWTPEGCRVDVARRAESAIWRGKPVTALVTAWTGAHMLDDGENIWRVTRSETWDGGPLGLSLTYSVQPEGADAERREYRKNLKAVVEQVFPGYTLSDA